MHHIFRTGTKIKLSSWLLLALCVAMFPVVGLGAPPGGPPRGHGGGGGGGGGSTETATTPSGQTSTFSGQATVVDATVLGIERVVLSDTGPLPPPGGALEASLLNVNVPGLLTAEVLHASTIGQGNQSRSEASVANLNLTVGNNTITADFLMARARAVCTHSGPTVSGNSEIVGLVINGQPIIVTGEPNQTVLLPLGTGRVVINEQSSPDDSAITVNALHVVVTNVADVVISSAHADVTCNGQPVCQGGDFVTGGGWITGTPSGARGNFGVAGGVKGGAFWGHLQYIDHGDGMHVKATSITGYEVVFDATNNATTARRITGTAEIDGQGGFTFDVTVADNGEPGRHDTFEITLSPGDYKASGTLAGGNIQLHRPCQ